MIKVGDLLQPVAKLVGDVTRDLHKLIDPKVGFITMVMTVVDVVLVMMVMMRQEMHRLVGPKVVVTIVVILPLSTSS